MNQPSAVAGTFEASVEDAVDVLRSLVDTARTADTEERRCEYAAIVANSLRPLSEEALRVRDAAALVLLQRPEGQRLRLVEVAALMRITRERLAQFRKRHGLLDKTTGEGDGAADA